MPAAAQLLLHRLLQPDLLQRTASSRFRANLPQISSLRTMRLLGNPLVTAPLVTASIGPDSLRTSLRTAFVRTGCALIP